jgi:hypothetical protein
MKQTSLAGLADCIGTPRRCMKNSLPISILTFLIFISSIDAMRAATYYLQQDMTTANGQTVVTLAAWYDQSSGGGNNATTLNDNSFVSNGYGMRTPTSNTTFGNANTSLTLSSGSGNKLTVRASSGNSTTIYKLTSLGGGASLSAGADAILNVSTFTNSGLTYLDTSYTTRTFTISFTSVSGAGDLSLTGGGTVYLSLASASAYTGNITWGNSATTILNFNNDVVSDGGLIALSTSRIVLDQHLTFNSVSIAGTSLVAGTYDFSYLNSHFDTVFVDGGIGSITVVPEPTATELAAIGAALFSLVLYCGKRRKSSF